MKNSLSLKKPSESGFAGSYKSLILAGILGIGVITAIVALRSLVVGQSADSVESKSPFDQSYEIGGLHYYRSGGNGDSSAESVGSVYQDRTKQSRER
jgi:hypothetical protein